jgi:hypothetical protein
MALSNIDKKHANELMLAINGQNIEHNALDIVKSNHSQFGKLKMIAKQMEQLKREAELIVEECYEQRHLQSIECRCKKISGTTYYLYENTESENEYFSLISPEEWNGKLSETHYYKGSYYYDFDKTFTKV